MQLSTQNLSTFPSMEELKKRSQSIAMLDAILCPEWEYRFFSFNAKWDKKQMMASMRSGEGDHYFILFQPEGVILKGFATASLMKPKKGKIWPGIFDDVPSEFADFLKEKAFLINETTFCIWRKIHDDAWHIGDIDFPSGKDPDGSKLLLFALDGDPKTYQKWAQDYYSCTVSLKVLESIYHHEPLTSQIVKKLNPDLNLHDLQEDIQEIFYPS